MHSSFKFLLVIVVTLICTNLPSRVEPQQTMKSLPTERHGSVNNFTRGAMNSIFNSSNAINVRNNNQASRNNHNRIIGGHIAKIGQFPFLVSIYYKDLYHCTGTLIRADWVLTALHCIQKKDKTDKEKVKPSLFTAFAGHTNLKKVEFALNKIKPEINPEIREVYETYPYENFVSIHLGGDIVLMQLKSNFNLGKNIQLAPLDPAGIPQTFYSEQSMTCTVVGWGTTAEPKKSLERLPQSPDAMNKNTRWGNESMELRYADVDTISTSSCNERYEILLKVSKISNLVHICTESPKDEGSCAGDSGGPLLCGGYQVGVTSYSYGCARNPDVYVRLASYRTWIDETINVHNREDVTTYRMKSDELNDTIASSTRIRPGAGVVGAAIIVIVLSFNVLCKPHY